MTAAPGFSTDAAAGEFGKRLDHAMTDALLSAGTADELRILREFIATVIAEPDATNVREFAEAFIENIDRALVLLEARS